MIDLTPYDEAWQEADAFLPEFQERLLEPKYVSGWLDLPATQLPRETAKIIGQPRHPPRKMGGGSARYEGKDAILLKFGRRLASMGITPHRVRACVERVREEYDVALWGEEPPNYDEYSDEKIELSFYIVGREDPEGFNVVLVPGNLLGRYITESGIKRAERDMAIQAALEKRSKRAVKGLPRKVTRKELDTLAGEGYELIDRVDAGSPVIVQNVTRYLRDQSLQLYHYLREVEAKERT